LRQRGIANAAQLDRGTLHPVDRSRERISGNLPLPILRGPQYRRNVLAESPGELRVVVRQDIRVGEAKRQRGANARRRRVPGESRIPKA
jgi:hypothetical protein